MHTSRLLIAAFTLCAVMLTVGFAQAQEGPMPWEDPNSGFSNTSGSSSSSGNKHEKIETVVDTKGGSKADGKTTSSSGSEDQKTFVNDFLDKTGDKIKAANGGSGWVWTWKKKWKVGADGKPYEVVEKFHKGNIGITKSGDDDPSGSPSSSGPSKPSSSGPSSSPSSSGSSSPSSPGAGSGPSSSGGSSPASGGGSGSPGSSGGGGSPAAPSGKATAGAPAATPAGTKTAATPPATTGKKVAPAPKPGVNPAPQKLPEAKVRLVIQNPVTHKEEYAKNNVPRNPGIPTRTVHQTLKEEVPEDTRVRIGLELAEDVNPKDVKMVITDDSGTPTEVKPESFTNYRHMFRIPNKTDYKATVYYNDPKDPSGQSKEIIQVTIPVKKLGFEGRTIDSHSGRVAAGGDTPAGSDAGAPQSGSTGSTGGSSVYGGSGFTSATSHDTRGSSSDFSDLYTDPASGDDGSQGGSYADAGSGAAGDGSSDGSDYGSEGAAGDGSGSGAEGGSDYAAGSSDGSSGSSAANSGGYDAGGNRVAGQEYAHAGSGRGQTAGTAGSGGQGGIYSSGSGSSDGGDSDSSRYAYGNSGAGGSADGSGSSQGGSGDGYHYRDGGSARSNSGGSGDTDYGRGQDVEGSEGVKNDGVARNTNGAGTDEVTEQDSAYILSLSLRADKGNVAQSFDFITDPFPTSSQIKKDAQVSFSIDMANVVKRDSVVVVLFDGKEKKQMTLQQLGGGAFAHQFKQPTAEAYVWIYGNTDRQQFSYKLSIPVTDQ